MAVEQLRRFLRPHRIIALDTSIFIYQLEANQHYLPLTDSVFEWMERSSHQAITSTITMTELLVPAHRENDKKKVDAFYGLLSIYPNLQWVVPDLQIADLAARLRAAHRLQTPDALQAAAAVASNATALITNDPVFTRIEAFETAVLDDYL
ncbi:MAG: PIN domain-containing protein [Candidatus Sulfotelmatobacter sp.]